MQDCCSNVIEMEQQQFVVMQDLHAMPIQELEQEAHHKVGLGETPLNSITLLINGKVWTTQQLVDAPVFKRNAEGVFA